MRNCYFAIVFPLLLFLSYSSYAQNSNKNTEEIAADTIVGSYTDSTIVYIIKKPPVKIKETIEVQKTRERKFFYFGLFFSGNIYSDIIKARSGYETYTSKVKSSTVPLYGYAFSGELWQAKKKIITMVSLSYYKLFQQFNYNDALGVAYKSINKFNYFTLGLNAGYWYKKENKISLSFVGGGKMNYFISAVGYTLDKNDYLQTARVNRVYEYTKFFASIHGEANLIIDFGNTLFSVGPYFVYSPFSQTTKTEVYSEKRNFFGLKIGLTNKLFN